HDTATSCKPTVYARGDRLRRTSVPAVQDRNAATGMLANGGDSRHVTRAFLDKADIVDVGDAGDQRRFDIYAGGARIVVDPDRYRHRLGDRFEVTVNLVVRQWPIRDRNHQC